MEPSHSVSATNSLCSLRLSPSLWQESLLSTNSLSKYPSLSSSFVAALFFSTPFLTILCSPPLVPDCLPTLQLQTTLNSTASQVFFPPHLPSFLSFSSSLALSPSPLSCCCTATCRTACSHTNTPCLLILLLPPSLSPPSPYAPFDLDSHCPNILSTVLLTPPSFYENSLYVWFHI